jgi:hypothetical protein
MIRFCLVVHLITGLLQEAGSQFVHPYVMELDSFIETQELNKNWLYHKGDDPVWAAFDYDDSNWDTLSTTLDFDRINEDRFDSIGWFRLHLEIRKYLENRNSLSDIHWKIRMGIHSGKVIGGIVG